MKIKPILAAIVVAVTSVGGYWYYSPYLALKNMREAAQSKDAEAFNAHVDYPKVRESLKGQFSAIMADTMGASEPGAAAFGAMLGMALVNQMVEVLVRPEMVMRAMEQGDIKKEPGPTDTTETAAEDKKQLDWKLERFGVNKVIAYSQESGKPINKDFGVVFERSGFADWKLTEFRMSKPAR